MLIFFVERFKKLNYKFFWLDGHYKICVESNDRELFKNERVKFSLILDTDQDDLEGK